MQLGKKPRASDLMEAIKTEEGLMEEARESARPAARPGAGAAASTDR